MHMDHKDLAELIVQLCEATEAKGLERGYSEGYSAGCNSNEVSAKSDMRHFVRLMLSDFKELGVLNATHIAGLSGEASQKLLHNCYGRLQVALANLQQE